jgi:hypothetical protein
MTEIIKMKTVKQKLEAQVKRIEDTFPQLITNQMYLGAKDHPDAKLYGMKLLSIVGIVELYLNGED